MPRIQKRLSVNVFLGVVLSFLLVGCGNEDEPSSGTPAVPSSTADTTPPPSTDALPEMFQSARHGYRLEVPPRWEVNEYVGTWTDLQQFSPGAEVPGEDVVATVDRSSFLVMNSMEIPAGTSPDEWRSAFDAIVASELSSDCEVTTSDGVLAGQPATVVEQTCDGAVIRGHSLVHNGRGYYFTTRAPENDVEALALIDDLTESIKLNP